MMTKADIKTPFFGGKVFSINARIFGAVFGVLILLRNAMLIWLYGYSFFPDSTLYIHLGNTFFSTGYLDPKVTFPYPLINAITSSYSHPYNLLFLQAILTACIGGFFVYVIAKHSRLLAFLIGFLFVFDLVWGGFSRSFLTDSLFGAFNLLCLGILLDHFDRRGGLGHWDLLIAGLIYGWTLLFRPSNIFLVLLLVPTYVFLTHSWKKTATLILGGIVIFMTAGFINLRGTGTFYILSNKDSYTNTYLAFPLFVYNLYSPENGKASLELNSYLTRCYPGENVSTKVNRSVGDAVDSANNMNLILKGIVPCIKNNAPNQSLAQTIFQQAYLEALFHNPLKFTRTIIQENAIFFRYNDPYILRLILDSNKNYGCNDISWCGFINKSRLSWNYHIQYYSLYEKAATKILQVYLAPVGLIAAASPERNFLPFNIAWFGMVLFLIIFTRGRERFLAISSFIILQYTSLTVILGFGFTERYAAMMTPLQVVLSGMIYSMVIRAAILLFRKKVRSQ
jgi:hypothetical protein